MTAPATTRPTWADLEAAITAATGQPPEHRTLGRSSWREYRVPHPSGGSFSVEVTLRPRYSAVAVDRWWTTSRPPEADAWFEATLWPLVRTATEARSGDRCGWLPAGDVFAFADPVLTTDLHAVLTTWLAQEMAWAYDPEDDQ
ncbi:MAG: hypothetical protein R2737_07855 [Candidatus Nanopelagicales bacterium]